MSKDQKPAEPDPLADLTLIRYRVVQIDVVTGVTTILHETVNRDEASECYRAAKRRHTRSSLKVVLMSRPDPGWTTIAEI